MSETNESSSTNPFADYGIPNFFSQWTEQSTERLDTALDQWEKWEKRTAEQAQNTAGEVAKLMQSGLEYSLELHTQMRKQAVENSRKMLAAFAGDDDR